MEKLDPSESDINTVKTKAEARAAELAAQHIAAFLVDMHKEGLLLEEDPERDDFIIGAIGSMATRLVKEDGKVNNYSGFAQDVHPRIGQKMYNDKLVPGALNKEGLEEELKKLKSPKMVLFVDLTNLKAINDKLGHTRGDEAIQDTYKILRSQVREGDLIARIGGDEFVVVPLDKSSMPSEEEEGGNRFKSHIPPTLEQMIKITEGKISQEVERYRETNQDLRNLNFNLAIGGAVCDKGSTFEELQAKAEEAMYIHKNGQHSEGQYRKA